MYEVYQHIALSYPTVPHYVINEDSVKIPAAWLIEQCGLNGKELGGAAVYERQPLILVNKHNAKPSDIIALADHVKQCVYNKFNITLNPEVNYI